MPAEAAALIVAGIWLVVAAVLASSGRKALKQTNPRCPRRSAHSRRTPDGPVNRRAEHRHRRHPSGPVVDLDALQDKVSPSAIIERRKAATRSRLAGVKDSVMGSSSTPRPRSATPLTVPFARPREGGGQPARRRPRRLRRRSARGRARPGQRRRVSGEPEAGRHGQGARPARGRPGQGRRPGPGAGSQGSRHRRRRRRSRTPPSSRRSASRTRASPPPTDVRDDQQV